MPDVGEAHNGEEQRCCRWGPVPAVYIGAADKESGNSAAPEPHHGHTAQPGQLGGNQETAAPHPAF